VQQRVRDRALTEHSGAVVKQWLRAGEQLTEAQAAAAAFNGASLEVVPGG
jgi:hypothetical protein